MKQSLFFRFFLAFLLIIVLLTGLILLISFRLIKEDYLAGLRRDYTKLGLTLRNHLLDEPDPVRPERIDSLLTDAANQLQVRISLIDPTGRVLFDSENDPQTMDSHNDRLEIIRAQQEEIGTSFRHSHTTGRKMLYIALILKKDRQDLGVLRFSLFADRIDGFLSGLKHRILWMSLGLILLSLMVASLFSRLLTRPIRELAENFRQVRDGNWNTYQRPDGPSETRMLAENFNIMVSETRGLIERVSRQGHQLHAVISAIQESLMVIDRNQRIVMSNQSFRKLNHDDHPESKYYYEVIRRPELDGIIRRITQDHHPQTTEFEIHGCCYMCNAAYLDASDEVVVMIHDITELKKLETVKKEFVANVSHELRTPLTAIKGFVETLQDEVPDAQKHYLDIILRHTDRLSRIVQDLLILSSLENRDRNPEMAPVDIRNLIENVLVIFESRILEKGLTLVRELSPDLILPAGDAFRLEEMMINLIDNALKYTEQGSITIRTGREESSEIRIEVADTGLGIAPEHLPRLFERFYVVDKSRSKKQGGTGLGLSIVKHIVMMHQGRISIESQPGRGSRFIVLLPELVHRCSDC
ncbi:MAG: HAMP domain-containing protein [Candidatus Delongbacteria bacterium]|nr:HAMP domain-containing protein [Candidatus Delongbacteria bacterium]